jgi:hypothetical protein
MPVRATVKPGMSGEHQVTRFVAVVQVFGDSMRDPLEPRR